MHYLALAVDYDGTLATDGKVASPTLKALKRIKGSGRKLILVTGRELEDLIEVFPEVDLFDHVLVENGALHYEPIRKRETKLAPKADVTLAERLRKLRVKPLSVGRTIIATRQPHEIEVVESIRKLGLELQVIFNQGAVMVLPPGINKESGLRHALRLLGLSPTNVAAIGDGENDHALLAHVGFSVAVANAVPALKKEADWITERSEGAGVIEVIDRLVKDDLESLEDRSKRHRITIGEDDRNKKVRINPLSTCLLIIGPSGSGKTSVAGAIFERVIQKGFQLCIVDPEGDYDNAPDSVKLGGPEHPPLIAEIMQLLEHFENTVVNMLGIKLRDRPRSFATLMASIQELRARTGRPHFLVLDEVHHLLPAEWKATALALPMSFEGTAMMTVDPSTISKEVLSKVTQVIAVGDDPEASIRKVCEMMKVKSPRVPKDGREKLDVILWTRADNKAIRVRLRPGSVDYARHQRKYAKGDMEEDAFFFRGPKRRLNLRAQNLIIFCQIAEGIDDETWLYHLERGDYSKWIANAVQDKELAKQIEQIETRGLSARASREQVVEAISKAYTAAA